MTALFRMITLCWFGLAMPATAQLDDSAGAAIPPPGELAFAIPGQFHGRWLSAAAGCANSAGSIATIISSNGLQRGDHWSEPVELIEQTADGRRLAMQADLYFQAPPVLHRSVWQLSEDGNGLVIVNSRLAASGEEQGDGEDRMELVRCDG